MATRRTYLTFIGDAMTKPLIYHMGHKFKVVTNIRMATIKKEMGLLALELEGESDEIEAALAWIESEGVKVEPIEKNVIE